jgi:small subunit ribosomal protein S21
LTIFQAFNILKEHLTADKNRKEDETAVVEVKLKKGESVEKALRRLKKKMDKEGTMKEIRGHRYFEKPSEKRRRKAARARMNY